MKISRLLFLYLLTLWTRVVFADANTTISAAEYFVDTDPGEGNGTALTAQDGTFDSEVESIAPVDLNVTGLAVGSHLIGIRYKDDNNTWGEVLYQTIHVYDPNPNVSGSGGGGAGGSSAGFATITGAEYFVDTDPGEGNGTAFQAQDGAFDSEVESILPKDLNVTGLSVGPHLVGVRYKDNNNTWGEVLYQTIHVYDANPDSNASGGGGNGGGGGSSGGFATIKGAEYFVDTDPGEGNGTAFQAQDGAFDSEVESILPKDLNVTGLAVGPHLVGVRYQDNNNTWGEVLYQTIHVYDANPSGGGSGGGNGGGGGSSAGFATIQAAEYFVDTDPGEGNGTAFQAQDGAFDSEVESILPKDLNVTGLSVGPHLVGVRYKDNNNTWGEVLYQTIHVYDANPSGSGSGGSGGGGSGGASGGFASISAAEYFVDTDPGAGSGIAFQAKDGAFDSEVESILPKDLNVTGLTVGPHLVGVRYKDNNNTWGEVLYQTIHVYDANPDVNASGNGGSGGSSGSGGFTVIAGAEYFIGNDPGEGNATALQPKDGAFDSEVESTLTASLSLNGYALGTYLVGVRYMDNNVTWGDVLFKTIEVDVDTDGDGLADKAEAFYETNATIQDTDGDGYLDGEEVAFGSNPKDANSLGNRAPTSLFTSNTLSILENLPAGEFLAEFNATDGESNSTFTYSLADATGSGGNAFFSIDSNGTLRTAAVLDYETNSSHTVRVRVSDQHNYFLDKNFTIQVQDMDEGTAPTLGDGSEENPYQIDTLAQLKWLSFSDSEWEDKFFIQTSDINATETKNWANGYGFSPIAGKTQKHFTGTYNGQFFKIYGIVINRPNTGGIGLFSKIQGATLKNINITDGNFIGKITVGGLTGLADLNSTIQNSSFEGIISGQIRVGGLVGRNTSSQVLRSFSKGVVNAEEYEVGGIVGSNNSNKSKIIDCYSDANVSGSFKVGGFAGLNAHGGSITRSYSSGFVSNVSSSGGLVGAADSNITNSFWDINSSGVTTSAGGTGAVGKTTSEMMDPSTFLAAGWDFNASGGTWKMTAGQTYPRLAWENTPTTLPYDLNNTTTLQVLENQPVGTVVGHFTAKHLDVPSVLEFSLVGQGGANQHIEYDNDFFSMDKNGTIRTAVILDYEENSTLTINARVNDGNLSNDIVKLFTVQVVNMVEDFDGDGVEDAYDPDDDGDGYSDAEEIAYGSDPRDVNSTANASPQITLGNTFPNQLDANGVFHIGHIENKTHIIQVSASDADGDDLNYSIYGWQDLPNFEINASSGDLSFKNAPDFEFPNDHNKDGIFGIVLRVSDGDTHSDQPVWIWLQNENEAPSDLNITTFNPLSVAENQPAGTIVGQLTGSDSDANTTLIYSRVLGPGDQHNSYFVIDQNQSLRTTKSLDYESDDHNLSVRIRVRDEHNASLVKVFTIALLDMNDTVVPPATDTNQTQPPGDGHGTASPDSNQSFPPADGNHTAYPDHNTTLPPADGNSTTTPDHNQSVLTRAPIVQTGNVTSDGNGTYLFTGSILSQGQSSILEAGILLVQGDHNITQKLPADLNRTKGPFQISANNLMDGEIYFFRTYALSTAGESLGTIRRFVVEDINGTHHWWSSIASTRTDGWITSSWMGDLLPYSNRWAYHRRLGWIYMSPDRSQGYWLWRQENGWLWTNAETWPFLWANESTGWLYLLPANQKVLFYDYSTVMLLGK